MLKLLKYFYNFTHIKKDTMSLGQKIKNLRKEKGWTQDQLAKKLGCLQPHLNRWEREVAYPSLEALKKISKVLDVSVDTLIFDKKDLDRLKLKDKNLASKLKNIEKLSAPDKQMIIQLIESLAAKNKDH